MKGILKGLLMVLVPIKETENSQNLESSLYICIHPTRLLTSFLTKLKFQNIH